MYVYKGMRSTIVHRNTGMGLRHLTDWFLANLDFWHETTLTIKSLAVKFTQQNILKSMKNVTNYWKWVKIINNRHWNEKYSFSHEWWIILSFEGSPILESCICSVKCQSVNCLKPTEMTLKWTAFHARYCIA